MVTDGMIDRAFDAFYATKSMGGSERMCMYRAIEAAIKAGPSILTVLEDVDNQMTDSELRGSKTHKALRGALAAIRGHVDA